jgi:hypothetical protein
MPIYENKLVNLILDGQMSVKSFININGTRIKVSNIKNYGISSRIDQIEVDVETNILEDSVNLLTQLSIGGKVFPNIR